MSEIVAFIEARYAELEQAAEMAPSSPGSPVPTASPGRWRLGIVFGTVFDGETTVAKARSLPLAQHIALNDPAHVLADIAAKRLILDLHKGCDEMCYVVKVLAQPFAAHTDFDPVWAL